MHHDTPGLPSRCCCSPLQFGCSSWLARPGEAPAPARLRPLLLVGALELAVSLALSYTLSLQGHATWRLRSLIEAALPSLGLPSQGNCSTGNLGRTPIIVVEGPDFVATRTPLAPMVLSPYRP